MRVSGLGFRVSETMEAWWEKRGGTPRILPWKGKIRTHFKVSSEEQRHLRETIDCVLVLASRSETRLTRRSGGLRSGIHGGAQESADRGIAEVLGAGRDPVDESLHCFRGARG